MYSDHFTIENTARHYRARRLARAEHERRLALLARSASPLSIIRRRLLAACAGWRWRWRGKGQVMGRREPVRPSA